MYKYICKCVLAEGRVLLVLYNDEEAIIHMHTVCVVATTWIVDFNLFFFLSSLEQSMDYI